MGSNPPSTSALSAPGWPTRRVLVVGGALALAGASGYLAYRHFACPSNAGGGPFQEAERKKADGIDAYRTKKYENAIQLFTDAVKLLTTTSEAMGAENAAKRLDLLSSCQNNIAACYDSLGDIEQCLEFCKSALAIKPDYVKALARRAKCHTKLGQNEEAIDDYFDLIAMDTVVDQAQLHSYQVELDRITDAMIIPQLSSIREKRINVPLKIPQTIISRWLYSTVTNDPIMARMAKLDAGRDTYQGMDEALVALKRNEFDKIASIAVSIVEDVSYDCLERAQAVLLAARFYYYQGLKEEAQKTAQKFMEFWDKLDEAQKLANKDLHVAHISLLLTITELSKNGTDNSNGSNVIDEMSKQRCHQLVEEALRINPKNVDPLMVFGTQLMELEQHDEALALFQKAKKYDPKQPYLRFYEIFTFSLSENQRGSMLAAHNRIVHLQQAVDDAEKPPIFALLMLAKSAMLMQNLQLALEAVKKVLTLMPNCAYAIYLCGMMDKAPLDMQKLERAMRKSIETDPNYWEPYRILGKIAEDRHDFDEADKFYGQAIDLASSRDELMLLLKERLVVKIVGRRIRTGRAMPKGLVA